MTPSKQRLGIPGLYDAIKAKVGDTGTLINNLQTIPNVTLKAVGRAQNLGGGALRCQLSFEFLG